LSLRSLLSACMVPSIRVCHCLVSAANLTRRTWKENVVIQSIEHAQKNRDRHTSSFFDMHIVPPFSESTIHPTPSNLSSPFTTLMRIYDICLVLSVRIKHSAVRYSRWVFARDNCASFIHIRRYVLAK
jgi:hypothetical protein